MSKTILVVDDDPTQRRLIQGVLERDGFAVAQAESGEEAIDHLTAGKPADVILLDLSMPGLGGMASLGEMRQRGFAQPVIVVTATGGVDTVVKAMQAGAQDFFIKPASPERIIVSIRNALQMGDLRGEVDRLKRRSSGKVTFDELIGSSAPMIAVKRMGERAAKARHREVEQDHVGRFAGGEMIDGFLAALGLRHGEAVAFQDALDQPALRWIVIDDKDRLAHDLRTPTPSPCRSR